MQRPFDKLLILLASSLFAGPAFAGEPPVDFAKQVKPILESSCAECHAGGKKKGGLKVESLADLLKGGETGPGVVPGDSGKSLILQRVVSTNPDEVMPQKGKKLSAGQVAVLKAWIDQGATWDSAVTLNVKKFENAPLAPRKVAVPDVPGLENPIDRILAGYFAAHHVKPGGAVDDRLFARRAHLDLVGLLPTPERLEEFAADAGADKREKLVATLLADDRNYAEHWLSFWNDCLRNDYKGVGYIDGGRKQITGWLYDALLTNMPYDRFVTQLVSPTPESEGFAKGIVWRGTVSASQVPELQAAQNIGQVFLGINLKCASCHDSFISDWKLADAYGLANVYADKPMDVFRCEKATGAVAKTRFLFPQLGSIDANASRKERLAQLAKLVTSKDNGRFARTIVNRLWQKLMGRGLIEPADEMDHPAWDQDLLDWLAGDLVDNGYDLKKTLGRIVTSRAYQTASVGMGDPTDREYVFAGPVVKRMTAEQFVDAVAMVGGAAYGARATDAGGGVVVNAKWIWAEQGADKSAPGGHIYLRKAFDLAKVPASVPAVVTCDNEFVLYVNGRRVAGGDDWKNPVAVDLAKFLVKGKNVLAALAINWPDEKLGKGLQFKSPNGAGFVFYARLAGGKKAQDLGSDVTWKWSAAEADGWTAVTFDDAKWAKAVAQGDAQTTRGLGRELAAAMKSEGFGRASLQNADTLMAALGRPNREQVVTCRNSVATTLQCLELTNGPTLAGFLDRAGKHWAGDKVSSGRELVTQIYLRSLCRKPTEAELKTAAELIGAPATRDGVEDLLWAVMMLPEFQLVY